MKAAYAGGHFYIAMTSNYSDLYLYRYSASFEAEASGKLYLYNEDTGDMEAATISLYAFYASRDDEKLYLFNDLGQIFILPTDLSSLTKDPAAFMDSGFRELRLERTLNAATYDFLDTFYLVGKDRALYTLSHGVGELVKTDLTFAEEVSFLAYERAQNRLFVNYRLYPDVTVCNLSDLSVSFSFRNEFNLAGMAVDGDGVLYTLYKDGSDYVFTLQNVAELERSAGTGAVAVFCTSLPRCLRRLLSFRGRSRKAETGKGRLRRDQNGGKAGMATEVYLYRAASLHRLAVHVLLLPGGKIARHGVFRLPQRISGDFQRL